MSTIYVEDPLNEPHFGHAWRDQDGRPRAHVQLGTSFVIFSSASDARELAAVILTAADAIDALPPAEEATS